MNTITTTTNDREVAQDWLKRCLRDMPLCVYRGMLTALVQNRKGRLESAKNAKSLDESGVAYDWLRSILGDPEDHRDMIVLAECALEDAEHCINAGGPYMRMGDMADYNEDLFSEYFLTLGAWKIFNMDGQDAKDEQDEAEGSERD